MRAAALGLVARLLAQATGSLAPQRCCDRRASSAAAVQLEPDEGTSQLGRNTNACRHRDLPATRGASRWSRGRGRLMICSHWLPSYASGTWCWSTWQRRQRPCVAQLTSIPARCRERDRRSDWQRACGTRTFDATARFGLSTSSPHRTVALRAASAVVAMLASSGARADALACLSISIDSRPARVKATLPPSVAPLTAIPTKVSVTLWTRQ